jgi:polyhydroxyalkanoate synthase
VLFTTPIDFSDAGVFGVLTRKGAFPIEQLTSTLPLVPGQVPDAGAKLLSPLPNTVGTYVRLWERPRRRRFRRRRLASHVPLGQ